MPYSSPPADGSLNAASATAAPRFLYSALAKVLKDDILAGRYKVGEKIPTEQELQQRFAASRHTVREALRALKDEGLLVARAGIGTVVRSAGDNTRRYMQSSFTLHELAQSTYATHTELVRKREVIADTALSALIGVREGQQLLEASVLRYMGQEKPTAFIVMFMRPEHIDVVNRMHGSKEAVHVMVERMHGVRIAEVRQQITAALLDDEPAHLLKAQPGSPCLRITRHFMDAQDRLIFGSIGRYPGDRFSHDTAFRVQMG